MAAYNPYADPSSSIPHAVPYDHGYSSDGHVATHSQHYAHGVDTYDYSSSANQGIPVAYQNVPVRAGVPGTAVVMVGPGASVSANSIQCPSCGHVGHAVRTQAFADTAWILILFACLLGTPILGFICCMFALNGHAYACANCGTRLTGGYWR